MNKSKKVKRIIGSTCYINKTNRAFIATDIKDGKVIWTELLSELACTPKENNETI